MSMGFNGTTGVTFPDASTQATAFGVGMRNRIINGDFRISQYNGTTAVTPSTGVYVIDRFFLEFSQATKLTFQQNAGSITPPSGFSNYAGFTVAATASIGSGDYFDFRQHIEAFNTQDFAFGTSSAKTLSLSFLVYSSITGTFTGSMRNGNATRSFPFTYTISVANTWTKIIITIPGDTAGTWVIGTNASGGTIVFCLGVGSTYSTTAGAWAAGNYIGAPGATSILGTLGATFYITGIQLEVSPTATPFDYRPYSIELSMAQRYCEILTSTGNAYTPFATGVCPTTTAAYCFVNWTVPKRIIPTLTFTAVGTFGVEPLAFSGPLTLTAITASYVSSIAAQLSCTVASGLTAGSGTVLYSQNTTAAAIMVSAEL